MSPDPEERPEVEAALLARAQSAVDAAERILASSEILVGAATSIRDSGMTTRCAWCGRYRLGGRWVIVERMPDFSEWAGVTHGICEECVDALRAAGMSV